MIRILFGDNEAFKNKFMTSARTRIVEGQQLGPEFFIKEHTKPLFKYHQILTIHNLYTYQCFLDVFKILKLHAPSCLYYSYHLSTRSYLNHIKLLPPEPSTHFIYRSSVIWNGIRQQLNLSDMSDSVSSVKTKLRDLLYTNQHKHDDTQWLPSHDFNLFWSFTFSYQ